MYNNKVLVVKELSIFKLDFVACGGIVVAFCLKTSTKMNSFKVLLAKCHKMQKLECRNGNKWFETCSHNGSQNVTKPSYLQYDKDFGL